MSGGCEEELKGPYIASDIHVIGSLGIGPNHSIGGEVGLHARRLPGEEDGAIWGRCREVGPGHGRRVADDLGSFDEILEGLGRLETGNCRKSV